MPDDITQGGPVYSVNKGDRIGSTSQGHYWEQYARQLAKGFTIIHPDGTSENYVEDAVTGKAIPAAEWISKHGGRNA